MIFWLSIIFTEFGIPLKKRNTNMKLLATATSNEQGLVSPLPIQNFIKNKIVNGCCLKSLEQCCMDIHLTFRGSGTIFTRIFGTLLHNKSWTDLLYITSKLDPLLRENILVGSNKSLTGMCLKVVFAAITRIFPPRIHESHETSPCLGDGGK